MRISKDEYYLGIAEAVSKRSTCIRRQYGAVIVKNDEIIATGYNGSPRGEENCCDTGECWREKNGIPHGEQYEKCVAVHAEMNAIISAGRKDMCGATLYLAGFENGERMADGEAKPCEICRKMIANAGIKRIIFRRGTKMKVEIMDYRCRKMTVECGNVDDIDSMSIQILSGDELLFVNYKDGTLKCFDSSADTRYDNIYDGEYEIYHAGADNNLIDSEKWRAREKATDRRVLGGLIP